MEEVKRIDRAISRNMHEIIKFMNQTNALISLLKFNRAMGANFFRTAYDALYDDRMSHIIKVLDRDSKSVSLWYIYNFYRPQLDEYFMENKISIDDISLLSEKLKIIRDSTHFHIDKKGVLNTDLVWKEANITGDFLNKTGTNVYNILRFIYKVHFKKEFSDKTLYSGQDMEVIIKSVKKSEFSFINDY